MAQVAKSVFCFISVSEDRDTVIPVLGPIPKHAHPFLCYPLHTPLHLELLLALLLLRAVRECIKKENQNRAAPSRLGVWVMVTAATEISGRPRKEQGLLEMRSRPQKENSETETETFPATLEQEQSP